MKFRACRRALAVLTAVFGTPLAVHAAGLTDYVKSTGGKASAKLLTGALSH